MGRIVSIYGAVGGLCMPLITLAQDLIQGQSWPHQFASLLTLAGWVVGVAIYSGLGAVVALALEQSNSERFKALAVGLTLPATLTAIGHGATEIPAPRASVLSFIGTAVAGERVSVREPIVSISPDCGKCAYFIFDKDGTVVGAAPTLEATSVTVPSAAVNASILTPRGFQEAPLPTGSGDYILNVEPRSGFNVGLGRALGLDTPPDQAVLKRER